MHTLAQRAQHKVLTAAHVDFQKGLLAHALFKVTGQSVCDDLVQDTFSKAWVYMARGGKILVMKSFLFHTLNNLIIDHYRKHCAQSLDRMLERGFDPGSDPRETLVDALDGRALLPLIARLPVTYQQVVRMRYVDDLTLIEMAARTGSTKNALAVKVHRGLEKLKVLYLSPTIPPKIALQPF